MLNQHETKIIYNFEDHPTNIVIRFQCGCFESFPFRQNFVILVRQITWFRWNAQRWTSGVNVHNKNSKQYVPFYRSIINLKKILTFSVKDRYQLNYFICIKDFNAETITSLKLYLFSFFICGCEHHQRKTICLYVLFLISDRQCGTEDQYIFSGFLGVSMLQLLIIYRIYDYDMLTLSQ
jgi:hypothetical protein